MVENVNAATDLFGMAIQNTIQNYQPSSVNYQFTFLTVVFKNEEKITLQ